MSQLALVVNLSALGGGNLNQNFASIRLASGHVYEALS